jgi:pimeloyl-ACP methyl ester carboxylesterase
MEILVADICETISQLNLDQPMIMAHSCFGIVALEVAKKLPTLKGVILVACAPEWNSQSLAFTEKYYQTHAERARLANDKKRKALYLLTKKPTDSELSIEKYIADSARYWGNFEVTDEEILALWRGIKVNDWVANQFYETILPSHDLKKEIETIEAPVLLLAGERDYDSIPLVQWANYPHPSNFTIINCGPVGHWPQLENTLLFDNSVKNWIKST